MKTNATTSHNNEFTNEVFWLAGASSGMGLAVAENLASSGAHLILMARNEEKLKTAREHLLRLGAADVRLFPADVTDRTAYKSLAPFLGNQKIRGVLLNAGGPHGTKPSDLSWENYEEAHRLLLLGPLHLLQALLPYLKPRTGSVVAITSTTVKEINPSLPLSAAYRSALVAMLKNFAEEFGPQGIRFNNVAPGYTQTEKLDELASYVSREKFEKDDEKTKAQVYAAWAEKAALRRVATPAEIAECCAFLFSTRSSFVTGQTLMADGGSYRGY